MNSVPPLAHSHSILCPNGFRLVDADTVPYSDMHTQASCMHEQPKIAKNEMCCVIHAEMYCPGCSRHNRTATSSPPVPWCLLSRRGVWVWVGHEDTDTQYSATVHRLSGRRSGIVQLHNSIHKCSMRFAVHCPAAAKSGRTMSPSRQHSSGLGGGGGRGRRQNFFAHGG